MTEEIGRRVGRHIRELREAAGLTQAELAGLLLKSTETISNFERGKTLPSLTTIAKLAEHLGVGLHEMLPNDGADVPNRKSTDAYEQMMRSRLHLLSPDGQSLVAEFMDLIISRQRRQSRSG